MNKDDLEEQCREEVRKRRAALNDDDQSNKNNSDNASRSGEYRIIFLTPRREVKTYAEKKAEFKDKIRKDLIKKYETLLAEYEDNDDRPDKNKKDANNTNKDQNGVDKSNGRSVSDPNNESNEWGYGLSSLFSPRRRSRNKNEEPATSKSSVKDEKLKDTNEKRREELRKRYEALLRYDAAITTKKDANNYGKGKNGTSDIRSNRRDECDTNNESKEQGYSFFSPRRPSKNEDEEPGTSKSSYEKQEDIAAKRREELRKHTSGENKKDAINVAKGKKGTSDINSHGREESDSKNKSKERGYSFATFFSPSKNENGEPTSLKGYAQGKKDIEAQCDEAPDKNVKSSNNTDKDNRTSNKSNGRIGIFSLFSSRKASKNETEEPGTSKSPDEKNEDINAKYRDGYKDSQNAIDKKKRGLSNIKSNGKEERGPNNEARRQEHDLYSRSSNNKNEEPSGSKGYDEKKKDINAKLLEKCRKRYEGSLDERKIRDDKYDKHKNTAINNDKDKSDTSGNQSNERHEGSRSESKGWISGLFSLIKSKKASHKKNEESADSNDYGRSGKRFDDKDKPSSYIKL